LPESLGTTHTTHTPRTSMQNNVTSTGNRRGRGGAGHCSPHTPERRRGIAPINCPQLIVFFDVCGWASTECRSNGLLHRGACSMVERPFQLAHTRLTTYQLFAFFWRIGGRRADDDEQLFQLSGFWPIREERRAKRRVPYSEIGHTTPVGPFGLCPAVIDAVLGSLGSKTRKSWKVVQSATFARETQVGASQIGGFLPPLMQILAIKVTKSKSAGFNRFLRSLAFI
jgi:hypothetical protein